jgi:hypothetical protein
MHPGGPKHTDPTNPDSDPEHCFKVLPYWLFPLPLLLNLLGIVGAAPYY